jgi:anthranilate phosphoribosyltransferase
MNMVDYTNEHGGLHKWTWWTTLMDIVDYTLGLPTIIHGLDGVSPKFGLTHRHINEALGLDVNPIKSISVVHHVHLCSPQCPSV